MRNVGLEKYFKSGVTPATTLWTLIYNFRVIYFCNSWATKTPANQWFSFVYSISNCRDGVLHPAETTSNQKNRGRNEN
jgi:hypothetical protein